MKLLFNVDTRIDPRINAKKIITSVPPIVPVSKIYGATNDTAITIGIQTRTRRRITA